MDDDVTVSRPCWFCQRNLDAETSADIHSDKTPNTGDFSLCFYCCAIAIYDAELMLVPPTHKDLDELKTDVNFRNSFAQFCYARQYIMLEVGSDEL